MPSDRVIACNEIVLEEEKPTSLPYIEMTLKCMARFGVEVERPGFPGCLNRFRVPRGGYVAPCATPWLGDAEASDLPVTVAIPPRKVSARHNIAARPPWRGGKQAFGGFPLSIRRASRNRSGSATSAAESMQILSLIHI